MKSLIRIFAVMRKEFLQLSRDRLTFGMIVGIPLIQLLMFGYAINTDVRNLSAAYSDEADTHLSREFIAEISASQVINIRHRVSSAQELNQLLDNGTISIGIYIPDDFDRRVINRDRQAVQLLVDGTDPIILGVAQQLTSIPIAFDSQTSIRPDSNLIEVRNYYNPERRSAVNIVPGLVGVILTMTMVLFTAVAIVREKERGNMELLINTPVKTPELMLGKIFPYIFIGLIQLVIILSAGRILFSVPMRGSGLDVFATSLLFIATNLSLGLLISTISKTQFQAMQMAFFILLPSILLSGFMFPFDGMPVAAQYIAEVLPLTHFNRLIRGIVLRGADMMSMWDELVALAAFMFIALTLAIARFNKRLD
ncbi:MAG: ABC transporter permease subunit [Pseudomonadales bacterium]|nr:ABC transporter permease subunit [Pseudomonadales bacterium]